MPSKPRELPPASLDLGAAPVFQSGYSDDPCYPIVRELGQGNIHRAAPSTVPFALDALLPRIQRKLVRSDKKLDASGTLEWKAALFRTRAGNFIQWSEKGLMVFSSDHLKAERIARRLQKITRGIALLENIPGYALIKKENYEIRSEFVEIGHNFGISDEELPLLYGSDFVEWHERFLEKFTTRDSGISIFCSSPGCGKTTYIKSLFVTLAATHRFYYIAPHDLGMLSDPDFVGFWSEERRKHKDRRLVLVLEDAEGALMSRESDNRNLVSLLLNFSDGLLGQWLKMQVICTVNFKMDSLDPALLRPGRLLSKKIFNRLSAKDAARWANHKGISLRGAGGDMSLAEIFNDPVEESEHQLRVVGFAA